MPPIQGLPLRGRGWAASGLLGAMLCVGSVSAAEKSWWTSLSTSWFTQEAWMPWGIPGSSDTVNIGNLTPAWCVVGAPGAVGRLVFVYGNGLPGRLRIEGSGRLDASTQVGIGMLEGYSGQILVTGVSARLFTPLLVAGYNGTGKLEIEGGAQVDTDYALFGGYEDGNLGFGELYVRDGGWLFVDNGFGVGQGGTGFAHIQPGGILRSRDTVIGALEGHGELLVESTEESTTRNIAIASGGATGVVTVANGGRLNTVQYFTRVGDNPGSDGFLRVTDPGSHFNTHNLRLGVDQGRGELLVENGGRISMAQTCSVGSGGDGYATVTGEGSLLEAVFVDISYPTGNGQLTLANGGTLHAEDLVQLWGDNESTTALNIGAPEGSPAAPPGKLILDNFRIHGNGPNAKLVLNHTGTFRLYGPLAGHRLTGSLKLVKLGPGTATLESPFSDFWGGITISEGVLAVSPTASMGSGPLILQTGGVLMNDQGVLTIPENRTITLAQGEGRLRASPTRTVTFNGGIEGPGDLVIANDGGTVIIGGAQKTYAGSTIIGRDSANGGANSTQAILQLNSANVLPPTTRVRFHAGEGGTGILDLNGRSQTVRSVIVHSGEAVLQSRNGAAATLTVTSAPGTNATGMLYLRRGVTLLVNAPFAAHITAEDGSTLGGTGQITGVTVVTMQSGSTLAPGVTSENRVGQLILRSVTLEGGSTIDWQIRDAAGAAGEGWDVASTYASMDFAATPEEPITLRVTSLEETGAEPGMPANFDPTQSYVWSIASTLSAGVITGFDPEAVVIDASGFAGATGTFSLQFAEFDGGQEVQLVYVPSSGPLVGDMNCDGTISVGDIGGFVLALTNPEGYEAQYPSCDIFAADTNGDGAITVGDIGAFVSLVTGG
jgi:T5SS/PEP-CTERM-associated repeat protein